MFTSCSLEHRKRYLHRVHWNIGRDTYIMFTGTQEEILTSCSLEHRKRYLHHVYWNIGRDIYIMFTGI